MKKVTTVNFKTKSGSNIEIKVTRVYGNETQQIWIDQYVDSKVFVDDYSIEVKVDDGDFKDCQLTTCQGYNVVRFEDSKSKKSYNIVVPDDKLSEIKYLIDERLTDEISEDTRKEIEIVKDAISKGRILPKEELSKKHLEYKNTFLEGGEGFNIYDYYISSEYAEKMKKKYPEHFEEVPVPLKKRGKIITDREELLVCQQYKDGWTIKKIAVYANISQTTVMAILKRRDVVLRKGKQITIDQERQVVNLYQSGETIREIKNKTGIKSEQTIYRIIGDAKINKRRKR